MWILVWGDSCSLSLSFLGVEDNSADIIYGVFSFCLCPGITVYRDPVSTKLKLQSSGKSHRLEFSLQSWPRSWHLSTSRYFASTSPTWASYCRLTTCEIPFYSRNLTSWLIRALPLYTIWYAMWFSTPQLGWSFAILVLWGRLTTIIVGSISRFSAKLVQKVVKFFAQVVASIGVSCKIRSNIFVLDPVFFRNSDLDILPYVIFNSRVSQNLHL